jgi:hypothetical protein
MKKVFFIAVVLLITSMSVFAQEAATAPEPEPRPAAAAAKDSSPIEFHLNFAYFGFGIHMPFMLEGSIELLKFGIEHKTTGLGVAYRPFYFYGRLGGDQYRDSATGMAIAGGVSVINITAYWNVVPLIAENEKFVLAPFVDFNYLFMGREIDPSRYQFSAGLQGGILRGDKIKSNTFAVEAGFRVIDGFAYAFAIVKGGR